MVEITKAKIALIQVGDNIISIFKAGYSGVTEHELQIEQIYDDYIIVNISNKSQSHGSSGTQILVKKDHLFLNDNNDLVFVFMHIGFILNEKRDPKEAYYKANEKHDPDGILYKSIEWTT